ncbi:MAG: hypothetical protein LBR10_09355 [Prevotellaceae bacterium]|nr:hypothetical protein [Prevotellaceae bacterium]
MYRTVRTVVWEVETGNNPVSPTRFGKKQNRAKYRCLSGGVLGKILGRMVRIKQESISLQEHQ